MLFLSTAINDNYMLQREKRFWFIRPGSNTSFLVRSNITVPENYFKTLLRHFIFFSSQRLGNSACTTINSTRTVQRHTEDRRTERRFIATEMKHPLDSPLYLYNSY